VAVAIRAETPRSHASHAWVAAKNGSVEARSGIARQCTAQIAGSRPDQPEVGLPAEAPGGSLRFFQIVPASTLLWLKLSRVDAEVVTHPSSRLKPRTQAPDSQA
jgi:hypothetical protein